MFVATSVSLVFGTCAPKLNTLGTVLTLYIWLSVKEPVPFMIVWPVTLLQSTTML